MAQPCPGYFCGMRTADNRVSTILGMYERDLAGRYDGGERRAIVRTVFREQLGWDAAALELRKAGQLSESELLKVYEPLKQLGAGMPLQYVLGRTWFHGLQLQVGPGVLIPRPETEELVEHLLRGALVPRQVVDIGTGSGCIALALRAALPSARVTGIDVSSDALRIAQDNAGRLGLQVEWQEADVLDPAFSLPEGTDLVVSNPPYVPRTEESSLAEHVRAYEPHLALFVDADDPLLFHRRIGECAAEGMEPGGQLWFEGHHRHAEAVGRLLEGMGFRSVEVLHDMSGSPRFIHAEK
jgi:release factor glutamine methyltransferase